jgi:hypothetical protein
MLTQDRISKVTEEGSVSSPLSCIVNAHTLHKRNRKNILLYLFYEMVTEGLSCAWHDAREWVRSTPAGRLNRTDF